jgi:hypothetical protein
MFSSGQRRWLLKLDNGEFADQEWVNNMVKDCYLYHEHGSRKGEPITSANLQNIDDAFFNHPQLQYRHEEGVFKFDLTNPLDQILVAAERARTDDVTTNAAGAQKSHVRYLLIEGENEKGVTGRSVNKKVEAYKLMSNMGLEKKKIVVQIMKNMEYSSEPSEDSLNVEIDNIIVNEGKLTYDGKTYIDYYLEVAKMDSARLVTLERVQRGLRRSIIRRTGNVYQFNGVPIGSKIGDVHEYFFRTENSEEYERLLLKLGDETKGKRK